MVNHISAPMEIPQFTLKTNRFSCISRGLLVKIFIKARNEKPRRVGRGGASLLHSGNSQAGYRE